MDQDRLRANNRIGRRRWQPSNAAHLIVRQTAWKGSGKEGSVDAMIAPVLLVGVVPVVIFLAVLTGAVSGSRAPALESWSFHPWRIFWLSHVLILGGFLSEIRLLAWPVFWPFALLMVTSAIQGLRVTWMRSRRRAVVILLIPFVVLVLPGLTQGWSLTLTKELYFILWPLVMLLWVFHLTVFLAAGPHFPWPSSPTLISSPLVILLWMFSAWLAETVGKWQVAGVSARMATELQTCNACGTKNAPHRSICLKCGVNLRRHQESQNGLMKGIQNFLGSLSITRKR